MYTYLRTCLNTLWTGT